MNYGSVCSGIEAATVAWHPLGWSPAFFSEIEKFPSHVLSRHYPHVPNRGDMTRYQDWPDAAIDLPVGGTPCQSFSVAGLRKGMADPRGNLALTYLAIADRYRPEWLVWENVPGVLSSNGGRDFGAFLGGLGELGYGFAYRVLDAQYVRVDGFGRAVPQRRRRVFVVGNSRDWRRAAAVLFERESLRWHTAPRREAGQGPAPTISARPTGGGGLGTDFDCDGGLIVDDAARCVTAGYAQRLDWETENFVAHVATTLPAGGNSTGGDRQPGTSAETAATMLVAHTLLAKQNDSPAADLDTYVTTPYTLAIRGRDGKPDLEYRQDGTANAILTPNGGRAGIGVGAIAFGWQNSPSQGDSASSEITPTLDKSKVPAVAIQAGALRENPASGPDGVGVQEGLAYTIEARAEVQAVQSAWAVRRLTPTECERLQGFPDGYTDVPPANKTTTPDGPRYKALGNSMAVNVMRWIGHRIQLVDAIAKDVESRRAAA